MDQAKAIINIKEGIIELEGPVDFVRPYLEKYKPVINHPEGLPKEGAVSPGKAGPPPEAKKRAPPRKAERVAPRPCAAAIGKYLESGFFEHPRSFKDLREHLVNNRVACKDTVIRAYLRKLVSMGSLKTTGIARAVRYYTSARS